MELDSREINNVVYGSLNFYGLLMSLRKGNGMRWLHFVPSDHAEKAANGSLLFNVSIISVTETFWLEVIDLSMK
ncbi:hypothetical protein J6590_093504, partial [Homalodisca vitripennis]